MKLKCFDPLLFPTMTVRLYMKLHGSGEVWPAVQPAVPSYAHALEKLQKTDAAADKFDEVLNGERQRDALLDLPEDA